MKNIICVGITLLSLSFSVFADNELDDGPGLFSGKKGEFTLLKTENYKDKEETNKKANKETQDVKLTKHDMSQKKEFMLFKNWKQHKEHNTETYQEFLLWIEYKKISQ